MSEAAPEHRSAEQRGETFRAVADAATIETATSLASALVDECRIHLEADGVRLSAVDPATVASVDVELDGDAFEVFEGGDGVIGVDLARLDEIVGMADRGQLVEFALDGESRTLELRVGDLEYTLALLDPETIRSPPDRSSLNLEFDGSVAVDAGDLHRAVRAADMVSDHVALGMDEGAGEFYATAQGDTDDVSLSLSSDDLEAFDPGDAHSLFSIDYLTAIDRALPKDAEVELRLGTEAPIEIGAAFADGAGSVEYLVSPRIAAN